MNALWAARDSSQAQFNSFPLVRQPFLSSACRLNLVAQLASQRALSITTAEEKDFALLESKLSHTTEAASATLIF